MMTKAPNSFKNKKVLVYTSKLASGGVATANWLLDHGAHVVITDAKSEKRIEEHLKKHAPDGQAYEKARARLELVAEKVPTRILADTHLIIKKPTDELALFCETWPRTIIGVSGAQGKTTTAVWAAHLIGDAVVAGYDPEKSPMAAMSSRARIAIVEGDVPEGRKIVNTSGKYDVPEIMPDDFASIWGEHNTYNVKAAMQIARFAGSTWADIGKRLSTLPPIAHRQEVVHQDRKLMVINDTTATTPEAAIAALQRWGGPNCILVAGGTDDEIDYTQWALELPKYITANNTIFLSGTATSKMKKKLDAAGRGIRSYDSLQRCWSAALKRSGQFVSAVILFSPGAGSSEIFVDEFARGAAFNALVKEEFT